MTKKTKPLKKTHECETDQLIDIENIVGASELTAANVIEVKNAMDLMEGANVMQVVACSHHNAEAVMFNWPKARIILKSGKDGADLALIKVATDEDIAKLATVFWFTVEFGLVRQAGEHASGRKGAEVEKLVWGISCAENSRPRTVSSLACSLPSLCNGQAPPVLRNTLTQQFFRLTG